MPLAPPVLAPLLAAAATKDNPPALGLSLPVWLLIATAWLSHIQAFAKVGPKGLTALPAGGTVLGTAKIKGMDGDALGATLAVAASSLNPVAAEAALPDWKRIANAFVAYVEMNASCLPLTIAAPAGSPSPGGALSGAGKVIGLDGEALGEELAKAAVPQKPKAVEKHWKGIAGHLAAHIMTMGIFVPGSLAAAPGGGPILIGKGAIQ